MKTLLPLLSIALFSIAAHANEDASPWVTPPVAPVIFEAGKTAKLTLKGNFPTGLPLVTTLRSDVEAETSLEGNTLTVTLKSLKTAIPGPVHLAFFNDEGEWDRLIAARISGKLNIELVLENGWSGRIVADRIDDTGSIDAQSEWRRGKGKEVLRRKTILGWSEGTLEGVIVPPSESMDLLQADAKRLGDFIDSSGFVSQMEALSSQMVNECTALPESKQEACIEGYSKRIEALSAKMEKGVNQLQASAESTKEREEFGCSTLRFSWENAQIRAQVDGCEGSGEAVEAKEVRLGRPGK